MSSGMSREEVIAEYKRLQGIVDEKRQKVLEDKDLVGEGESLGFLFEEHFLMMRLAPDIYKHNITITELGGEDIYRKYGLIE